MRLFTNKPSMRGYKNLEKSLFSTIGAQYTNGISSTATTASHGWESRVSVSSRIPTLIYCDVRERTKLYLPGGRSFLGFGGHSRRE